MPDWFGASLDRFQLLRQESHETLRRLGTTCERSGMLEHGSRMIAIHTDIGPPSEDRETNQDYALAWSSMEPQTTNDVKWAIALADGVSSAWYCEYAAEIACWAAIARLVLVNVKPRDRAHQAATAASETIAEMSRLIKADPITYQPPQEFASTWDYILREGLFLQTTLCLAWQQNRTICLAFVGDGGAFVQTKTQSQFFGALDEMTHQTQALGPHNRVSDTIDAYEEILADDVTRMAVFTDGVGRGVGLLPDNLWQDLEDIDDSYENSAQQVIERWMTRRPADFQDNLSLAVLTPSNRG